MYEKILVTLDGSKLAELALPYAEGLAQAGDSELRLLRVCRPSEKQYFEMDQSYVEKQAELIKSHIKEDVRVRVNSMVLVGEPAKEVVNYAEQNDVDLIVMSSHGRTGIMLWALGGAASKIIQRVHRPVLLIRAKAANVEAGRGEILNRILVPLDSSEAGEAVLPYAFEIAKKLRSEIILLQVVPSGKHVHTVGGLDYVRYDKDCVESLRAGADEYLARVRAKWADRYKNITHEVRVGDAAHVTIKYADETNSRLVVIASHGQSSIKQWMFGHVAHKILLAGNTHVLLVRVPEVKK